MVKTYSVTADNYGSGLDMTSGPEQLKTSALTVAENVRFSREGGVYTRGGFEQKIDLATSAKVNSISAHENAMFAKSGTKIHYSTNEWTASTDTGETRTAAERDFFYPRQDEMYVINATDGLLRFASDYTTPDDLHTTVGTCISELEDSMLIGNGDLIQYSGASTEANPEFFYDFTNNGAGSKKMSSTVNALCAGAGIVLVGMAKGIDYAYTFDLDTGALLTRSLTTVHGVPNAWCISYIENNTFAIFTGRRVLLAVADGNGVRIIDDPFSPRAAIDYPIRRSLQLADDDQSLAFTHFDPTNRELHVSVLKDGISQIHVLNVDLGNWSIDTGKPYSCMTNWKFRVYAGDDNDDKIYLDNELTRDNTVAIRHRIVTPIYNSGDVTNDYLKFTYSGLLSGAGQFTHRLYVNGLLVLEEDVTAEDLIASGLMSTAAGVPLGSGTVGASTVGTGGTTADVFPFRYPLEILFIGEQFQAEWEIFDEGTQFELRKSRLDAETSDETELDSQ